MQVDCLECMMQCNDCYMKKNPHSQLLQEKRVRGAGYVKLTQTYNLTVIKNNSPDSGFSISKVVKTMWFSSMAITIMLK